MVDEKNDIDQLTKEIQKIITENSEFVARIMDDEFEGEEEEEGESPDGSEELI